MPRSRHRNLRFPMGGLERRFGYQAQRPFTTVDAMNVRPDGTFEGRERGGSRPGLEKVYALDESFGPVQMLADLDWVPPRPDPVTWRDEFDGLALQPHWVPAAWSEQDAEVTVQDGVVRVTSPITSPPPNGATAWLAPLFPLDNSRAYTVQLYNAPYLTGWGKAFLYLLLDNNPAAYNIWPQNGIVAALEHNHPAFPGQFRLAITQHDDGPGLSSIVSGDIPEDFWGPLVVQVYPNGDIRASVPQRASVGLSIDPGTLVSSGIRVGFGLETVATEAFPLGGFMRGNDFSITYDSEGFSHARPRSILFAGGAGLMHYESAEDGLVTIPPTGQTGQRLQRDVIYAASYNQDLFIADYGDLEIGGGNVIDVEPKVVRYDRENEVWEMVLWEAETAGVVPIGNPAIAMWHDRIILAGAKAHPHILFLGAMGDPYDWDFSRFVDQQEPRSAWASVSMEDGNVPEPITALVPHTADYLIVGCTNSIWAMRGDIAFGGRWDNVSRVIGFLSHEAWCTTPAGTIAFLTADGLYVIAPGPSAEPQSISRERLPNELLNISPTSTVVSLAYDVKFRGIHIYLSLRDRTDEPQQHWWFDWETKGFWPLQLADDHAPMVVLQRQSSGTQYPGGVLLGCRDGGIRRYVNRAVTDNGRLIPSYVFYGPIPISDNTHDDGLVTKLVGIVGQHAVPGAGRVFWSLYVGNTPEEALRSSPFADGEWSDGVNLARHPRARGSVFFVKVWNAGTNPWTMEGINATTMKTGKQKLP